MAQPYDLSGIASVQATIAVMLADQDFGSVNFSGGAETWVPSPVGWFNAILTSGASPSPTTVPMVRINLKQIRTILDLVAGGTGSAAANAVQVSTPPSLLLETGKLVTGPTVAFGPVVNSPSFVAATNYNLSGIASLQATVAQMLTDSLARTTIFTGWGETWKPHPTGQFQAILVPGGNPQTTNMGAVLALYTAMRAQFDLLGTKRTPPSLFILNESLLDGTDVLG